MMPLLPKTFHDLHFHSHLIRIDQARIEMLSLN